MVSTWSDPLINLLRSAGRTHHLSSEGGPEMPLPVEMYIPTYSVGFPIGREGRDVNTNLPVGFPIQLPPVGPLLVLALEEKR